MLKNKKLIIILVCILFFQYSEKIYIGYLDGKIIDSGAMIEERIKSDEIIWENVKYVSQCKFYYPTYVHRYQTCLRIGAAEGRGFSNKNRVTEFNYRFRGTCRYFSLLKSCFLFDGGYFSGELPRGKTLFIFNKQGEITWRYQDKRL